MWAEVLRCNLIDTAAEKGKLVTAAAQNMEALASGIEESVRWY